MSSSTDPWNPDHERDDMRDALALVRACLDFDVEASQVITDNCDLLGVLITMTRIAAEGLVEVKGECGAREFLDRYQRQAS